MAVIQGGCHCGQVRFEITGEPFHETLCHCDDCRRIAGAPAVAWFTIPHTAFAVTNGRPKYYASSERALRSFCPNCGTPLTYAGRDTPEELDVTTASLDNPENVPPLDQTETADRLSWTQQAHLLSEWPGRRPA
jgi:hypothetical protein